MEELTEKLRKDLGNKRDLSKKIFKMAGSIHRGVKNGRFNLDKALEVLEKEGAVNER